MGNAITQDTRAIWLTLRDTGAWWTVKALTRHWQPSYAHYEVEDAVNALHNGGFVESRWYDGRDQEYCFTSTCKALPDLPPVPALGGLS